MYTQNSRFSHYPHSPLRAILSLALSSESMADSTSLPSWLRSYSGLFPTRRLLSIRLLLLHRVITSFSSGLVLMAPLCCISRSKFSSSGRSSLSIRSMLSVLRASLILTNTSSTSSCLMWSYFLYTCSGTGLNVPSSMKVFFIMLLKPL